MTASRTSKRRTFIASLAGAGVFSASALAYRVSAQGGHGGHHGGADSTPAAACATPGMMDGHGHGHGGIMGTPAASPMAMMEFDIAYIDMMIPHHESIIALAEVAVEELQDERLIVIAEAILDAQPAEIAELRTLREKWYGSAEPEMMSNAIMARSMGMQDGCVDQHHMDQMSAEWQLAQFAAAEDKDLAFIDQVIPHHQMAIDTSEVALKQATHQEIKDIAERVIAAQEAEIAELEAIRGELAGTPAA